MTNDEAGWAIANRCLDAFKTLQALGNTAADALQSAELKPGTSLQHQRDLLLAREALLAKVFDTMLEEIEAVRDEAWETIRRLENAQEGE